MIRWFTKNDIAANFLLAAILLGGIYTALNKVPLEVSPTEDFGQVDISMTYRGGKPSRCAGAHRSAHRAGAP
ncbi:hypothetical protein N9196_02225 [Akkermansiaceae bacterium]|nr:hypothetical protein [bacterium]MDB4541092.1 hypothetical protein [Akkermansiaceae bacterium]MDB4554660.1 hypothetical protein [Akkermansiaceae bacterium]